MTATRLFHNQLQIQVERAMIVASRVVFTQCAASYHRLRLELLQLMFDDMFLSKMVSCDSSIFQRCDGGDSQCYAVVRPGGGVPDTT